MLVSYLFYKLKYQILDQLCNLHEMKELVKGGGRTVHKESYLERGLNQKAVCLSLSILCTFQN